MKKMKKAHVGDALAIGLLTVGFVVGYKLGVRKMDKIIAEAQDAVIWTMQESFKAGVEAGKVVAPNMTSMKDLYELRS